MSGEKIGESNGTRGIRRVISTQPKFIVEVSFEDVTTLMGVEGMNLGILPPSPQDPMAAWKESAKVCSRLRTVNS